MKFTITISTEDFDTIKQFIYKPHQCSSQKKLIQLLVRWFGNFVTESDDDRKNLLTSGQE